MIFFAVSGMRRGQVEAVTAKDLLETEMRGTVVGVQRVIVIDVEVKTTVVVVVVEVIGTVVVEVIGIVVVEMTGIEKVIGIGETIRIAMDDVNVAVVMIGVNEVAATIVIAASDICTISVRI